MAASAVVGREPLMGAKDKSGKSSKRGLPSVPRRTAWTGGGSEQCTETPLTNPWSRLRATDGKSPMGSMPHRQGHQHGGKK